jgi:simple sugar transport system substrate-binding protein
MSRLMKFFILLLIVTLALAACGGGDEAAPEAPAAEEPAAEEPAAEEPAEEEPAAEEPAEEEPAEEEALEETEVGGAMVRTPDEVRIIVVSHGQASDPFWSVVKNGVDQAAEDFGVDVEYQAPQTFDDFGVDVEYQAPQTFDMVEMSQLIDAAIAANPTGLVVSIPDADALEDSILGAVDAGIPVISMNSGSDVAEQLGIAVHVGQTEYEAGLGGGEKMAEAGVTNAICVNQEVGNVALDLRCQGFTDGLGGTVEVLAVDLADPIDAQNRISGALTANPDVNGILTLGPTGAAPALAALEEAELLGEMAIGTFDLSPEVLEAIDAGDMLFAIDQQQYLQGYLPIALLTLFNTNLNTIANDVLLTGPGFVTQDTAAAVIGLSAEGTR